MEFEASDKAMMLLNLAFIKDNIIDRFSFKGNYIVSEKTKELAAMLTERKVNAINDSFKEDADMLGDD